jgi:hypothetical protein
METPNPCIERTHNGGARLRAPSRSAAPLCAAHVKRLGVCGTAFKCRNRSGAPYENATYGRNSP